MEIVKLTGANLCSASHFTDDLLLVQPHSRLVSQVLQCLNPPVCKGSPKRSAIALFQLVLMKIQHQGLLNSEGFGQRSDAKIESQMLVLRFPHALTVGDPLTESESDKRMASVGVHVFTLSFSSPSRKDFCISS